MTLPASTRPTYRIGLPYAGDRFGGSNVSSLALANGLKDRGHSILVLTHGDGRAADEASARGLTVDVLPPLSPKAGYSRSDRARLDQIGAFRESLRALKRHHLDIVHVNDLGMLRTWALPAFCARRTLVAHWRTALAPSCSVGLALRSAAAIIAISERSRSVLPAWTRERTWLEYNPIENFVSDDRRQVLRAGIRTKLRLPENAVLIGVFGSLIRRKRSHVLADVVSRIPSTPDGRPVFGVICGDRAEPLDDLLFDKINALNLERRIRMVGFVQPAQDWMAACDLILAPAVDEAFGRTPLEAFASGTPALVSSDCGAIELVRDDENTIVLPPEPIERWVGEAAALLADPSRISRIVAQVAGRITRLSAGEHAGRIEAIYGHLSTSKNFPVSAYF